MTKPIFYLADLKTVLTEDGIYQVAETNLRNRPRYRFVDGLPVEVLGDATSNGVAGKTVLLQAGCACTLTTDYNANYKVTEHQKVHPVEYGVIFEALKYVPVDGGGMLVRWWKVSVVLVPRIFEGMFPKADQTAEGVIKWVRSWEGSEQRDLHYRAHGYISAHQEQETENKDPPNGFVRPLLGFTRVE